MNKQKIFSASLLKHKYVGVQKTTFEFQNFYIFKKETILLKGNSGSGKTTLLRLIERSLNQKDCRIETDCTAVLIYQDLRLVAEKTALENVLAACLKELPFYSFQYSPVQIEKAKFLLQKVGMLDFAENLVSELSGGQKQRIAIVRALMSSPQVLLADECFSQLDKENAMSVYDLIKNLQNEFGFSIVISQHASVIEDSFFDRKINVDQSSISTLKAKDNKIGFYFLWLLILGALMLSILTLDYSGYNSKESFYNALDIIQRLIKIDFVTLAHFNWAGVLSSFLVTLKMAMVGTSAGFILALPLSILAARNISQKYIYKSVRFFLMTLRTVPALVWALIFVAAFGIGSFPGICALAIYSIGYFGKLIYESLEDLEQKSFSTIRLLGASRYQAFVVSLLPQARPVLVAHFIFMLEYNIRAASLLGLVGAGGIGQELMYNLEWRRFSEAGIILAIMVLVIFFADKASDFVRRKLLVDRGN
ncbi:MAG: phosphonate ABC transporter, permease protein PhnE [Pseudobdellovibrionaceae bacterium]